MVAFAYSFIAEISRAEGLLAELHTHRTMAVIFLWSWLGECFAGATPRRASSQALTTSCIMRVRRFVFKTVVSSYRSSNTHLSIKKWERESFKVFKQYSGAAISISV